MLSSSNLPVADLYAVAAPVKSPEEAIESELNLTFVGDIMVHTPQFKSARQTDGSYDFNAWFQYVKTDFQSSDLMIGNLETTLSERNDISGYPSFHSPPQLADALKNAGFDILTTANNHSLDNHLYGIETTLKLLRERAIVSTGTYLRDETALPLIMQQNNIKIGFIASTYGTNGIPLPKNYPHVVNINDVKLYQQQIDFLKQNKVDVIIAMLHWGNEYQRKPSQKQTAFAKQLAELGVDIIIGSHPHVLQPDGWVDSDNKKCYVVYSLGNAISNQRKRYRDTGLAVKLTLHKIAGQQTRLTKVDYMPFWVDKFDENQSVNYAIIPLVNTPDLARLSKQDKTKMTEALADFKTLYQIDDLTRTFEWYARKPL